ncbi:MAG TPA: ATP-binding protein, partial [Thermomicrobiales bacterium]|nr:ATP-binding protein [Thermomicrobiales bacterium]
MSKVLVLPGFEFTATFGFHVLAIFDPSTSIRMMEHLLLLLGVPEDRFGSGEVGATSDVLRAYDVLAEAGALVIGAHVNSAHGVAMRNIRFGGQTKIAYTQDKNLHALEVTDLTSGGSRSTASFFNGTKAEYSRRMHCIQGSDAHRLHTDPARPVNLGIGDRATEFYLASKSFGALKACLQSTEWDYVRPARSGGPAVIAIDEARDSGPSNTVAFFERNPIGAQTSTRLLVRDVAAMANGSGGMIYAGVGPAAKRTVTGVGQTDEVVTGVRAAIADQIDPACPVTIDVVMYERKPVLVITVPEGSDRPYGLSTGEIPIRRKGESINARRDEILTLARGGMIEELRPEPKPVTKSAAPARPNGSAQPEAVVSEPESETASAPAAQRTRGRTRSSRPTEAASDRVAPMTGVEIVDVVDVEDIPHYTMRDLRTDQLTRNVTAATARSLWAQAIRE